MSVMILFSSCLAVVMVLPLMGQPMSLGFSIFVYSILTCGCIGLTSSSWYGYVFFLVYIGGLLVMFAYVAALAPNNYFSGQSSLLAVVFFTFFWLTYSVLRYLSDRMPAIKGTISDVSKMMVLGDCGYGIVLPSGVTVMIFLGVVLLISLLAVVKVCYYQRGPLRPHSRSLRSR